MWEGLRRKYSVLDREEHPTYPSRTFLTIGLPTELSTVQILAPNEGWDAEYVHFGMQLSDDEGRQIQQGLRPFILYGIVEYKTMVETGLHETRFCFTYNRHTLHFDRGGPSDYTKYT